MPSESPSKRLPLAQCETIASELNLSLEQVYMKFSLVSFIFFLNLCVLSELSIIFVFFFTEAFYKLKGQFKNF